MAQHFYSSSLSLLNVFSDTSEWEVMEEVKEVRQVCSYLTDLIVILRLPLSRPGRCLKVNLSWALFWVLWKCSITVGLHQQNALLCQLLCRWWFTPSLALRNPAAPPASLCCDLGASPFREDVRRHHTSYLLLQPCYLPGQLWKC